MTQIETYIEDLIRSKDEIVPARLEELKSLAEQLVKLHENERLHLTFVCTHNSRRSQLAEIMMAKAIHYFELDFLSTWSSGTESTAFNPRMVKALVDVGFKIEELSHGSNPRYFVVLEESQGIGKLCFSKRFDDAYNPQTNLVAIMVCDHADKNCPVIPGAQLRFPLSFADPKTADDTPQEAFAYSAKVKEIGAEMFALAKEIDRILEQKRLEG